MSAARDVEAVEALFQAAGVPRPAGVSGFETALSSLHARALERWAGVELSQGAFGEALGRRLGARLTTPASIDLVRGDEVFLAAACAARDARALSHVERVFIPKVRGVVARQVGGRDLVDDVLQALRKRLFAHDPPGISGFLGLGPLQSWLCAAGVREALDQLRSQERYVPEDEVEQVQAHVGEEPALDFVRKRHARDFRAALRAAFDRLEPQERLLLRWSHVDRLSIDDIAALQQAHRATAARRLVRARARLVELTRAELVTALAVTEQTLESLIRVVRVDLDITLPSALVDDGAAGPVTTGAPGVSSTARG
ncbi:MAG: sigma-70 family RNA polymerase sigma factor, partial [Myxococcaceae bacterium]|nr:sigma-70 family RNA polymerase sigma factor [Myxococcaceae bacterium]